MKAIVLALSSSIAAVALAAASAAEPVFPPWGITLSFTDSKVSPGMDFFRYCNGGWLQTAVIPSDRRVAGVNLELDQLNESRLKQIVSALSSKPDAQLSAEERKLRDLYNAFEDTQQIERAGLTPAQAVLSQIAALKTHREVATFMGAPATQFAGPYDIYIDVDDKNPDAYAATARVKSGHLPDRDYYLLKDKDSAAIRDSYRKYLSEMLGFAGVHDAARAAAVYALEERIAEVHWPAADRREVEKVYNPMSLSALAQFAPLFPWDAYFSAAGITVRAPRGERRVIVRE